MIYEFDGQATQVTIQNICEDKITFGKVSLDELRVGCAHLGLSEWIIDECVEDNGSVRSNVNIYDGFSFGIINIIDLANILGERDRIGFFLKKNLFLLVDVLDADNSTQIIFEDALHRHKPESVTLEKLIYALFDRLISRDNKALESIEFRISEMEDELEEGEVDKKFNNRLLSMKRELLILRTYYEQLIDIGEALLDDDNELWNKFAVRYFKTFVSKVERLSSNTQQLRELLAQLREAYQSTLDYRLNSIMKVFTVVTTIFLPLTLLTGWYGMNFKNMPELEWEYGYGTVILTGICVVIACLAYFRRKNLL